MKIPHARITEVRKKDKVGLHDQLNLHEPYSDDTETFCYSCGSPITARGKNTGYLSTNEYDYVMAAVYNTKRYNKLALDIIRRTPTGALYVANNIRKTDLTRKQASRMPAFAVRYALEVDGFPHPVTRKGAMTEPVMALDYATAVDRAPRRDTWMAVIDYAQIRQRYLAHFKMTEEELHQTFDAAETKR